LAGVDSVIVFVADGDRDHVGTSGAREPDADQRFRIGSVTKTFTAAIVLQLAAEGELRLDDEVARHLPGLGLDPRITIRQLLNHRSGLANVTDHLGWLQRASASSTTRPVDVLRFGASKPLAFPPGSRWAYSNTNYIALGLVIEQVTGRSYAEELQERILEPLGLENTQLPTTRQLPDLDDRGENPSVPWAAGALVSNARDIARFFSALLAGDVLSEESLAEMKRTVGLGSGSGSTRDGLGIFSTDLSCGRFWGHDGGILDYGTLVQGSEDGEKVAVVSLRGGAFSGPPPDTEALLCAAAK
jgi:D-alanyl-D-alanine carboxypeptidase